MNTITLTRISLHRPWSRRLQDTLGAALATAVRTIGHWQRQRVERHRAAVRRCLAAFRCWDVQQVAALDDHLLRDIGVPDWLREEAAARRHGPGLGAPWQGVERVEGFEGVSRW